MMVLNIGSDRLAGLTAEQVPGRRRSDVYFLPAPSFDRCRRV